MKKGKHSKLMKSEKIKLIKYQKDDMKIEGDTIVGTLL